MAAWLSEIGLSQYATELDNQGYDDLEYLEYISEEQLSKAGMTKQGHVKKFYRSLKRLRELL